LLLWSRQSDESWDVDCGLCRYFKELGLPLRFPGTETSYGILYQITSAEILARATTLAGQSESARNEICIEEMFRSFFAKPGKDRVIL
jgi:hypothetical protein